jgi:hypothetical protein
LFEELEECPTRCKDGSDIIIYHSKIGYSTLFDYNQDNYYDIVTVFMDQLINNGPLQAHIEVYEDFSSLNSSDCSNHIHKTWFYSSFNVNNKIYKEKITENENIINGLTKKLEMLNNEMEMLQRENQYYKTQKENLKKK